MQGKPSVLLAASKNYVDDEKKMNEKKHDSNVLNVHARTYLNDIDYLLCKKNVRSPLYKKAVKDNNLTAITDVTAKTSSICLPQKKYINDSTKTSTLVNTGTVQVHERKFLNSIPVATLEGSTSICPVQKKYTFCAKNFSTLVSSSTLRVHDRKFLNNIPDTTFESSDTIWPVQKKYTDDSTKTPTLANTSTVYVHERKFPKNVRDATFESSTNADLSTFSISSEKIPAVIPNNKNQVTYKMM